MARDTIQATNGKATVGIDETCPEDGVRVETRRGMEGTSVWFTPTEARALAALLLKHADRAEGREG